MGAVKRERRGVDMSHKKDRTGIRFGRLVGVRSAGKNIKGYEYWLFKCDCGNDLIAFVVNVVSGKTKSCGCLSREPGANGRLLPNSQSLFNKFYKDHLISAKKRGLESFLSKEEYLSIIRKPCFYCGKFSTRWCKRLKSSVRANSADRINNENSYTLDNTVSSCVACQYMKWTCSADEYVQHCIEVAKFHESKIEPINVK